MDFNYLNFSWIIEGALAGSVGATERKDLFFFKMQEISSVVRLDENNISAEPWQLFELFEPIDSLANADFEQINRISVFIEEQFEKWERPVVVTCETGNEIKGVIHVAGFGLAGTSNLPAFNHKTKEVNVNGTENIIDACLNFNVRALGLY